MTTILSAASESSVTYLRELFEERFGYELPAEQYEGLPQRAISAKITEILKTDGIVPADEAKQQEVIDLGQQLGKVVVPNATLAGCNRQIRSMTRELNGATWRQGREEFAAFLGTLSPSASVDEPVAVEADADLVVTAPSDDIPF